jgi:hypothetical protein
MRLLSNLSPCPLFFNKGKGSVGKRGAKPLSKISSSSPFKGRDTEGESKGGEASLI